MTDDRHSVHSPEGAAAPAADPGRARQRRLLAVGYMASAGSVLVWSRFAALNTSFWHDEAVTALRYIDPGPRAVFSYYIPNDHPLFSLLAWVTTESVGRSEPLYRFWSVVPAVAAVGLTAWWAWRHLSPEVAGIFVLLVTVSPLHMFLAPQARGYGLGMLAGAGLIVGAVGMYDARSLRATVLFGISGFVGIATLPVFVLPFLGHAAVLAASAATRRRAVAVVGLVGAAALSFYERILSDVIDNADQKFGEQLSWHSVISSPYEHFIQPTLTELVPERLAGARETVVLIAAAILSALAIRLFRHHRTSALSAHLVVPVLVTYAILTAGRFYVEQRFVSSLLVNVMLFLAIGLVELWKLASAVRFGHGVVAALLLLALVIGLAHTAQSSRDTTNVALEDPRYVAEVVRGTGITNVISNTLRNQSLTYYLGGRFRALDPEQLSRVFCRSVDDFVYIDHNLGDTPDPDMSCLVARAPTYIQVDQRRGSFEIWIVSTNGARPASLDE